MNKYIIFFASGWIALFSSNVYTACLENGGSNICKRAMKSDWVLIDSYNLQPINISSGYKLSLLPSDAKPLMSLVYADQWDDRQNKFVHTYRFNDDVLSHQKRWDRYTPSSESRLYDYISFGVNYCNHWSAPETCEPYALRFRSYWHCYNEPGIENGKIGNIDKKTSLQYPDSKESYLTGKIFNSPPYIRICEIPINKIKGKCDGVGNPCSITTGNKFQRETDWTSPTGLLSWFRTYNSIDSHNSLTSMGQGWLHNYQKSLKLYINDYQNNIKKVPLYQVDLTESDHQEIYGTLIREGGEEIDISGAYSDETIAGQNGWFIARDKSLKLTQQADGLWRVNQLKTGIKEYYDITGKFVKMTYTNGQFITLTYADVQFSSTTLLTGMLVKVTDSFGRSLQFNYNSKGLISVVILPNNKQMTYQYDDQRRLVSVTRPSYGTKTYHYSESIPVAPSGNPNLLTGITDEAGKRYANYAYDPVDRGVLTEHADGAQKYTLQHTDSYTRVTDPNGTTWLYNKILASGTPRVSSSLRAGSTQIENSYDQAGNITQKTEKGLTTKYTYDLSRNLETSRTEAVSTAQERKIETTWHGDFPKPTEIKESSGGQILRVMVFSYDNRGNALSKTITDPQTQEARTWLYEYNNYGQLIKETNPQGQISNYQYDETNGNLLKTISADGITTTYSQHNSDGQPQHIESSNGQIVDLVYDDAGRIIQQKQTIQQGLLSSNGHSLSWWQVLVNNFYSAFGSDAPYSESNQTPEVTEIVATQIATTNYEYDLRGLLIATKLPDGERIEYTYDDAHRLTEIKDQSGNRTVYSLNASGDITQTEVYGGSGQLEAKNQQVFDSLGRLQQSLGNSQQQQITSYNNYDQVQSDKNALNQSYSYSYDVLGRQISETDPLGGFNKTEYDSFDQIKKVIDAKSGTTTYQYNAFGEKTAQNNPDTGTTVYQYQNGLLKEKTDALQLKHQYEYDTQGRITLLKDQKQMVAIITNKQNLLMVKQQMISVNSLQLKTNVQKLI